MTTIRLYRVALTTRAGLKVYAIGPGRPGLPVCWTNDPRKADRWMHEGALEIHARLLREHKSARLENAHETLPD